MTSRKARAQAAQAPRPRKITWWVKPSAKDAVRAYRTIVGPHYRGLLLAFQAMLADYIHNDSGCTAPAFNISPMGGLPNGAKMFKVRWMYPGCGKSGGLRVAIEMRCREYMVLLAGMWDRREDPSDEEFARAFAAPDGMPTRRKL